MSTSGTLAITTTSLPDGTQSAQYLAFLQATGGTPPYTWAVTAGLLPGLAIDQSTGVIFGSANSSTTGKFSMTVQVTDSSSPAVTVSATLTLIVGSATGSNCNNIFIDVGNSTPSPFNVDTGTHVLPLTDLGTQTYLGAEGGLYPGGANTVPSSHESAGVTLAGSIQPLDSNGNPSSTGKYVLLSIGMSNAASDFLSFIDLTSGNPSINPNLVLVNGAQSGQTADIISNPSATFWSNITNTILPAAGVTQNQVVAAWVYEAIPHPSGTFPSDMTTLTTDLEEITQILVQKFPKIKLAYFSPREYGGYSNSIPGAVKAPANPEPFAYENGFAVKNTIIQQLNDPCAVVGTLGSNLNFDPTQCSGVVNAPWLAWSAYTWANGMIPRSDGAVWTCQDIDADGTHPNLTGRGKVANMLLNFFETDPTATPWFLKH